MLKKSIVKKTKISLTINIIIFIFTLFASIVMFTGFKFMHGIEPVLESTKLGMFRFFTVDSNMFMGLIALIFAYKEIQLIKGKINNIPKIYYILKLMGTTAVSLTFVVVFAYLGPISKGGIPSMLMNSNLFYHFLTPVLSIVTFVSFEKNNFLKKKDTLFGIIPTILYAIYYLINILIHIENGKVSPVYDWYWFVQSGVWTAVIVAPMILFITYIISLLLYIFSRKKNA